jgi:hypothetical protein
MITMVDTSWMLPCISKQITGMDCPGCGIQRSISLFFQGQFSESFLMYPALIPIGILFSFLVMDFFLEIKSSEKIKLLLMFVALGTVIASYIIKMYVIHF